MCGLLAISDCNKNYQNLESPINNLEKLNHRGPDGSSHLYVDNLFLGHTRLSIIDLELGSQPLSDSTGRFSIIYNGEIFNYRELREALINRNYSFRTESDTEVLLYHFIEFGIEGLEKFDGFFSFVIYDKLKKVLWFSRDRFGIKPLYMKKTNDRLILASEIKSLSSKSRLSLDISEDKMDEYLIYGYLSGGKTFYSSTSEITPGVLYKFNISDNTLCQIEWFDVLRFNPNTDSSSNSYGNHWDRISNSIRIWSRSDVPISLLLSGGIDSSLIAYVLNQKNMAVYNLVPSGKSFVSEYDAALQVSRACQMQLTAVKEAECDLDMYLDFLKKFDSPIVDTNYWSLSNLCAAINKDGVKVTVSGDGSDELFGGYERHIKYAEVLKNEEMNFSGILQENHLSVARLSRLKHGSGVNAYPEERILWLENTRGLDPLERILRIDQKGFLTSYLKRQDEVGMLHSLEIRTPYLSNGIFELSRKIPSDLKTEIPGFGTTHKAFLKVLLKEVLGIQYQSTKKLRFDSFLKTNNEIIKTQLKDYFSNKSLSIWDYIGIESFMNLLDESSVMAMPGHDNTIFRVLSLSNFLEMGGK
jgi:asparagine synthase (glutamine-hydrolysing)